MLRALATALADVKRIRRERGAIAVVGATLKSLARLIDPMHAGVPLTHSPLADAVETWRRHGAKTALAVVVRHVSARADPTYATFLDAGAPSLTERPCRGEAYLSSRSLRRDDGVVPATRPTNATDFAIEVPFRFPVEISRDRPVAAIVHAFYPDVMDRLLPRLALIPVDVDLFVSTDTEEKKRRLSGLCSGWTKGAVEIRVFPNRGRDIAPKFVGFRDVYDRYEIFLHLHTKKSLHGAEGLASWRDHLVDGLCGSTQIAASALRLLEDERIGVVFQQHMFELRGVLDWGHDFAAAAALLRRLGIALDKDKLLEFPSGSMFWGRSAAIRPLLDLGLSFDDFPEEAGQVDGTLAHAIERIILHVAESVGYEWTKVARRDAHPLPSTILPVDRPADLLAHRLLVYRPLSSRLVSGASATQRAIPETRAIVTYPSRNPRPRLNLLVPTVNPSQTFGGVATALRVYRDLADALGAAFDRRIVVTCAPVSPEGRERHPDHVFSRLGHGLDEEPRRLVDAYDRAAGRLDLRDGDVFIATAWWTARFADEFAETLACTGRRPLPKIYLIQDDEPYFYGWSSKWALAEATYRSRRETIAVINSEELYAEMVEKYRFEQTYCLPYAMNTDIRRSLSPKPRERRILVYGRPSTTRNAFEALMDGLHLWQARNPETAAAWTIVSLGESYSPSLAPHVQNLSIEGKVDLATYGDHLSSASIGLSLMLSPHPSYPPLEMAEAGLVTIANRFGKRDPRHRFPEVISLETLEPSEICSAMERAVAIAEPQIGQITPTRSGTPRFDLPADRIHTPTALADALVARLRAS